VNDELPDLSKLKEQRAVDLSKAAIEARNAHKRVKAAANYARTMNRTFKGITGSLTRKQYVRVAIDKFKITPADVEAAARAEDAGT
jgi:hypothetical protein